MIIQSSPMIRQLSQEYNPPMFNLFQREWDLIASTNIYKKKKKKWKLMVNCVVFDKTGTLTIGKPVVVNTKLLTNMVLREFYELVVVAEVGILLLSFACL